MSERLLPYAGFDQRDLMRETRGSLGTYAVSREPQHLPWAYTPGEVEAIIDALRLYNQPQRQVSHIVIHAERQKTAPRPVNIPVTESVTEFLDEIAKLGAQSSREESAFSVGVVFQLNDEDCLAVRYSREDTSARIESIDDIQPAPSVEYEMVLCPVGTPLQWDRARLDIAA